MSNEIKDRQHAQAAFFGNFEGGNGPAQVLTQAGFRRIDRVAVGVYELELVEGIPANRESLALLGPLIEGEGLFPGLAIVIKDSVTQYTIRTADELAVPIDPVVPVYFNVYTAAHDQG